MQQTTVVPLLTKNLSYETIFRENIATCYERNFRLQKLKGEAKKENYKSFLKS